MSRYRVDLKTVCNPRGTWLYLLHSINLCAMAAPAQSWATDECNRDLVMFCMAAQAVILPSFPGREKCTEM